MKRSVFTAIALFICALSFAQNAEKLYREGKALYDQKKYSEALKNGDADGMRALIAEGRELKEENLRHRVGQPN